MDCVFWWFLIYVIEWRNESEVNDSKMGGASHTWGWQETFCAPTLYLETYFALEHEIIMTYSLFSSCHPGYLLWTKTNCLNRLLQELSHSILPVRGPLHLQQPKLYPNQKMCQDWVLQFINSLVNVCLWFINVFVACLYNLLQLTVDSL